MNDLRTERILDCAEQFIKELAHAQNTWQRSRVNPLPLTKTQLKKARKTKRLQEAREKTETARQQYLQEIRNNIIQNLSEE